MSSLLLRASIEGTIAVLLAGAVSLLLARRAPAMRCRLWWVACLKFLVVLSGVAPLTLPVLPAATRIYPAMTSALGRLPRPATASLATVTLLPWRELATASWILGVAIAATFSVRRFIAARRIVNRARPVSEPSTLALLIGLSRDLSLRQVPSLRVSPDVTTPQVLGVRAPVILLPNSCLKRLDPNELAMVLCHELLHVRRRDLAFGFIPALVERLFFFHPGAIVAARQYVLAREEACDREVLRTLRASPQQYGRLLLAMSIGPQALASAAGVSSSFLQLQRRLLMLESGRAQRNVGTVRWATVAILAAAILVPIRLSAADRHDQHQQVSISQSSDSSDSYIYFLDASSVVMSGDVSDIDRARELTGGDEVLWFRKNGTDYVVRDAATLETIRELHAAMDRVEKAEEPLERQEVALDEEQARIEAEQDKIASSLDVLSDRQDKLDERDVQQQEMLQRKQVELDRRLEALAARIEEMSAEQEKHATEIERASEEVERKIQAVLEDRIRSGAATPVRSGVI